MQEKNKIMEKSEMGNWKTYGDYIKKINRKIKRIERMGQAKKKIEIKEKKRPGNKTRRK